jgi:fatty acid desaturase
MNPHPPLNRYALRGDIDAQGGLTADGFEQRVEAEWHACRIDRKLLKQLMQRSDAQGLRHFGLWLLLLLLSGAAAVWTWGTWWCVPAFAAYGLLYSASDHGAHELSHGTPFKTRWLNEALLHLCGFMTLHEVHYWRWSHTRHHTHTLIAGRDPEIASPRPPSLPAIASDLFFLSSGFRQLRNILGHAAGRINADGRHFIPPSEQAKVIRASRVFVAIFVAVIAACVAAQSWLPALLLVLPRFYGGPLALLLNLTQHAGMPEDVHDHRLICRSFHAGPVIGFLYGHMNYHVEHHMFPMLPFHALPRLHEAIRAQCPPAYPSLWACWREILPALLQQRRDASYAVDRPLPGALQA